MNDSPRTDALAKEASSLPECERIMIDFARTLERELAVAQERIAELEALAKLYARPVIDKDGVLWIGDGVGYVSARSKEGK